MAQTDPVEWTLLDTDCETVLAVLASDGGNLYEEMNEPGSGELKIPLESAAAALVTEGMFIRCSYRGAIRGGFFVDNINPVNANGQEGEGQWLSLSGLGAMGILNDAVIWNDGTGNTSREFTGTKASILITLIDEAVARGCFPNLTYDFSASVDSDSNSWTDDESLSLTVGMSLMDVMRQFADVGIDFAMTVQTDGDFVLSAYLNGKGSNKSSTVFFRVGTNCEDVSEANLGINVKNVLQLKYRDGFAVVTNPTSISSYRRREDNINIEVAQSASSATTYGAAKLDGLKDPTNSIKLSAFDGVKPWVFVDYETGDTVTVDRFGVETSERVRGVQLSFDESGMAHVVITINNTIVENEINMGRKLDWLLNAWDTARDSKKLEVSYWAAIGDPNITYVINDLLIVGSNLYVSTTDRNLLIYNIASGGWTRVPLTYTPNCLAYISGYIYIGCFSRVVKYEIATGTITEIGDVKFSSDPLQEAVLRMAVIGTKLYCSGIFDSIDAVSMTGAAEYDTIADTWTDIGGGAGILLSDGTNLYMGASVWAGGTTWNPMGTAPSGTVLSMAMYGTHILMGTTAGDYLYEWDGATWSAFGGGVSNRVYSIGVYLTDVYIAGLFTDVGNYVAKYSGGAWWMLDEGLNAYASRLALYQSNDNVDVYVSGTFTTAGGKPALKIAAYYNNFEALADYLENTSGTFNLGEAIHNATAKTPMVAADEMPLWDSITKRLRKITWANLLLSIKTYTDGLYVALTGAQTVAGVKTFSSFPVTPSSAPSTDYEVANKKYVDDNAGGGGGTPGGSDTQVQFNDSGAFGGSADFIYDDTGKVLYLGETATSSGVPSQRFELDPAASASHVLFTWGTGLASFWKGIFANGTKGSPTAAQSGDALVKFRGAGYDENTTLAGSSTNGEIRVVAAENFDSTHHGANVEVYATPTTSTTLTKILTFLGSGHVDIASGKEYQVNGAQHTHAAVDVTYTYSAISPTTANVSAVEGTFYNADISGLTGDRDFNLPTPSAAGKLIGIRISVGDDTYELLLKINGTEWSRLFITGEVVEFISTGTGADDWVVKNDGRIPCKAVFHRITSSITTNTAATDTIADWNYLDVDVGNMGDLTNNRANIRRAGHYICGGGYAPGAGIADGKYANIVVYKNGTSGTRVQSSAARQSTAGGAASAIFGSVLSPLTHLCAAGDYLEYWYKTEEADRGLRSTDYSGSGTEVLKGMVFFSVIEVLR